VDVLLIDDHPLFRKALGRALWDFADELRVQEADSVAEAMDCIEADPPDLVLYDWRLPEGGGLHGLVAICQLLPATPVVVVSANEDPEVMTTALAAGARGYIPKSVSSDIMLSALRLVLAGETYVPAATLGNRRPVGATSVLHDGMLTARQSEVLTLLAEGCANKRIAHKLGIAEATVRVHVSDILQALRVGNRTEAVVRARQLGLLGASP